MEPHWPRRLKTPVCSGAVTLRVEDLEARTVPATTLRWTGNGGDNLWSDAANWTSDAANGTHSGGPGKTPGTGDTVVFPDGAKRLSNSNDIQNLTLASIQFTGAGYDISRNTLSLTGGISVTPPAATTNPAPDVLDVPVLLVQAQSFTAAAGSTLALNGGVNSHGPKLTLDGAGTVIFSGISQLDGDIEVGNGSTKVTGSLGVFTGTLTVDHNATLTDAGSVTAASGRIDDHGQINVAAPDASGQVGGSVTVNANSALTVESDGTLTDAGTVTLGTKDTNVLTDNGLVTIAASGTLDAQAHSQITLSPVVSAAVTGKLDVAGKLTIEHDAALNEAGLLTVEHGGTLTDSGTVTVSKNAQAIDHGDIEVAADGALDLPGGDLTVASDGTLTNAGSVTVSGKSQLTNDGTLTDSGIIAVSDTGTLTDDNILVIKPFGKLIDEATVTIDPGASLDDGGTLFVAPEGALNVRGAVLVEPDVTITNLGTVTIANFAPPAVLSATLTNKASPALNVSAGALNLDPLGTGTALNLSVSSDFAAAPGQQFTLVANADGTPVTGLFAAAGKLLQEGDTVNAGAYAFTISYKGGAGGNDVVLTYAGLRKFDITITDNLSVTITVDGSAVPSAGAVQLTAGVHTLADANNSASSVQFIVGADGKVSYDDTTLQGILTGSGTSALGVQGVPVTVDPTGVAALTGAFTADGVPYPTTGAQTVHLLPGSFAVGYSINGATTALNFAVSNQDQVTFNPSDSSQNDLARVDGDNDVVLQAPPQTFPVTFDADLLAQFGTKTFTLNGQSYPVRQPDGSFTTILLLPGDYTIEYQLPVRLGAPGQVTPYTLTFTVQADGTLTVPAGERGLAADGSVLTFLLPF